MIHKLTILCIAFFVIDIYWTTRINPWSADVMNLAAKRVFASFLQQRPLSGKN